jgi:hypothetical protein
MLPQALRFLPVLEKPFRFEQVLRLMWGARAATLIKFEWCFGTDVSHHDQK